MRTRTPLALLVATALAVPAGAAVASAPAPAPAPAPATDTRPGPAALHAAPPRAPQLENTGAWEAEPVLVSGAHSYRDGEWVYQDFLHDDHGAQGVPDPGSVYGPGDHLYSPAGGTFTYPADAAFAHDGADLVELRAKPVRGATLFRVTLNTLQDPARTAFTIALGTSAAPVDWPAGAGVSSPASHFVTWHGDQAQLQTADGRTAVGLLVRVDRLRRQVEVRVPTSAFDPGSRRVRTTVGVGLWDPAAGSYLAPRPGPASATAPGGGTPQGVALVNVGPRLSEPQPAIKGKGLTMADTAAFGVADAPWWRERSQSRQLTLGDVTPFSVDVDFAKLRRGVRDDSGVPRTGSLVRLFASRTAFGQGLDPVKGLCYDLGRFDAGAACRGRFQGQLQTYNVYVPARKAPAAGFPLTLLLHSLSANHNQYAGSENQRQLGERAQGSIVITPAGRGPDGFYAGYAEADTFEVWADVARRYRLDSGRTVVTGYSMGGFGTYRLLARYPDLFARGWSVVGEPGSVDDQLASLRHTPLLAWNGAADELVNVRTAEDAHAAVVAAGLRTRYRQFPTADHLTLASNDEWAPGVAFLSQDRVERDPAQVTYVVDPREDNAAAGVVADSAYWLSGLRVRDPAKGTGTIDVRSLRRGVGTPPVLPVERSAGVLTGGAVPAMAFADRAQGWGPTPRTAQRDALAITATNVRTVTVDVRRAGATCATTVEAKSDGPLTVVLAGCGRTVRV